MASNVTIVAPDNTTEISTEASSTSATPTTPPLGAPPTQSNDPTEVIVGAAVGGFVLVLIITVIVTVLVCRWRRQVKKPPPELPDLRIEYRPNRNEDQHNNSLSSQNEDIISTDHAGGLSEWKTSANGNPVHDTYTNGRNFRKGSDNPGFSPDRGDATTSSEASSTENIYANEEKRRLEDSDEGGSTYSTPHEQRRVPLGHSQLWGNGIGLARLDSQPAGSPKTKSKWEWQIQPPIIHHSEDDKDRVYISMNANEPSRPLSLTPSPNDPFPGSLGRSGGKGHDRNKPAPPSPCRGPSKGGGYINIKDDNKDPLTNQMPHPRYHDPAERTEASQENGEVTDIYINVEEVKSPDANSPSSRVDSDMSQEDPEQNYLQPNQLLCQGTLADDTAGAPKPPPKYINVAKIKPGLLPHESSDDSWNDHQEGGGATKGRATPGASDDEEQRPPYVNVEKYKRGVPPAQIENETGKPQAKAKPPKTPPKPSMKSTNLLVDGPLQGNQSIGSACTLQHPSKPIISRKHCQSESDVTGTANATDSPSSGRNGTGKRALRPPTTKPNSKFPLLNRTGNDRDLRTAGAQNRDPKELSSQKNSEGGEEEENGDELYENAAEIFTLKSQNTSINIPLPRAQNSSTNDHHTTAQSSKSKPAESNSSSDSTVSSAEKARRMAKLSSSPNINNMGTIDVSELKSRLKKTNR